MRIIENQKDVYTGKEMPNTGNISAWVFAYIFATIVFWIPYKILKSIFTKKDNSKDPHHKDYSNEPFPNVKPKGYYTNKLKRQYGRKNR